MFELQRQLLLTFLAGRGRRRHDPVMVIRLALLALLSILLASSSPQPRPRCSAPPASGRRSCARRAAQALRTGAHRQRRCGYLSVLAFVRVVGEAAAAVFITFAVTTWSRAPPCGW